MYNREEVEKKVEKFASENLGSDFKFRVHQKEAIVDIILNILNHEHKNYIVEAPTGSGKSLINIISACVLDKYYGLSSYILVSDLYLWEQYESFLKKYPLLNIAALKGQSGNYCCMQNGEDIKNADCRMSGLSWAALFNKSTIEKYNYECAYTCEYLRARQKAIKSNVCIVTYQLFLLVSLKDEKDGYNFTRHDVVFCDECHNIPNIVQMEYGLTVRENDFERIMTIYNQYYDNKFNIFSEENDLIMKDFPYKTCSALKEDLYKFWDVWKNEESRKDEDYECIQKYIDILDKLSPFATDIKNDISIKKSEHMTLTKDDIKLFKITNWYEHYLGHWTDFADAINYTSTEYFLKDITISTDEEGEKIAIGFKNTKEDYLVYKYLLQKANYKVFLSATIGGEEAYNENMGFRFDVDKQRDKELNKPKTVKVPSTFDFTESPIHFLNKFKMSYREKDISFGHLKNVIYSICSTKFKDSKGIIQTGSYFFAKKLYDEAPYEIKQRMLLYNGSREKNTMINIHKISENTILVGPTLNTGVDLPGDDCRFIIILKVPFPSMADKLVKEKIKLFPLWYNSATSNEIIQGIGRGVRYDGDWCVTYILDACFWQLYLSTKDQYSEELQKRIHVI